MELIPVEAALNAIVTLFFAYVALVGGASALKLIALDQEVRLSAKRQTQFINELGDLFVTKFEEKMLRREKRIGEKLSALRREPEKT
ncbi:hypothetical protein MNBD_NITROSPINAE04-576 [hydrothermal vent metagenome]|uniref:Uncharacterized protein n=1 Tax=hydrothermal vent metagenome TaxID=652676 RepID=A0A3B1BRR2_9ZZZZ